ncbi:MAG: stage 0 sporulation family protein [Deltaproteobacteria bacterium]|nr:stage 0 sporulation family protein [Deltaproteobacteria bacterium]MCW8892615.1 stage 0 sporulation family protein [Deltaproteobacteria bacterium]
MEQLKLVSISFHCAGKLFDFDTKDLVLSPGDRVIVETERGRALGTVITQPREVAPEKAPPKLKSVMRLATDSDMQMAESNTQREKEALYFCQQRVLERKMGMKLVRAEYLFDGSKIIFYFTADGRIDFRELVRDLAQHFRTRIEMRQIGVRDEAKLVGGLGICGRELCCSSYLREFAPVSVKMAKAQGLALNPTKISGQCGRLLCCLAYEYETYNEMIKSLPKCGKKLQLSSGTAEVISLDILAQKVTLAQQGGDRFQMHIDELQADLKKMQEAPATASGEKPQTASDQTQQRPGKPAQRPEHQKRRPKGQERKEKPVQDPVVQQTSSVSKEDQEKKKNPRRRRRPRKRSNRNKSTEQPS